MTKIGITELSDIWISILDQIGVEYSEINSKESYSEYSCIILNSLNISTKLDNLLLYMNNGGAIIDITGIFCQKLNFKLKTSFKDHIVFNSNLYKGLVDIYYKIKEAFNIETQNWETILISPINKGIFAFLGLPIDKLIANSQSKRYKFLSSKPRHPEEEVSKISKGPLLRVLFNLLKEVHLERNIIFYHKWFFPSLEQNIFLFREDTDYCKEKDIIEIQEIATSNQIKITWFIHVKENLNFLSRYKDSSNDEIAVHCFNHATTNKKDIFKDDVDKAISELNKIGIFPTGHASPYGIWNKNIDRILNKMNFLYTSEFSILYNSLPMKIPFGDSPLQIPVHPICIDSLLKSEKTDDEIFIYYKSVIDYCTNQNIPIALFDHPGHGHYNILNDIFAYIKNKGIKSYTFEKYANWWNKRTDLSFTVDTINYPNVNINTNDNVAICFWTNRETYCLTDKSGNIKIDSLERVKIKNDISIETPQIKNIRKFDLNLSKRSLLAKLFWRNKK